MKFNVVSKKCDANFGGYMLSQDERRNMINHMVCQIQKHPDLEVDTSGINIDRLVEKCKDRSYADIYGLFV